MYLPFPFGFYGNICSTIYIYILYINIYMYLWELYIFHESFPGGSVIKNAPTMQETRVRSQGWEDPLEKEMATHSSILAWEIPWTEEPGWLESMGSQRARVRHDWVPNTHICFIKATGKEFGALCSFLERTYQRVVLLTFTTTASKVSLKLGKLAFQTGYVHNSQHVQPTPVSIRRWVAPLCVTLG